MNTDEKMGMMMSHCVLMLSSFFKTSQNRI